MYFKNTNGQIIGKLHDDGVYRAHKKGSKHTLKIMDAWGIDASVFSELKERGCTELRFLDDETGIVYAVTLADFESHMVERDFDGLQVFVSKKYWRQEEIKTTPC